MTLPGLNQSVYIPTLPDPPIPRVSLESFNELQEVQISIHNFRILPRSLENLISSITSRKFRRLSLTFINSVDGHHPNHPFYIQDYEGDGVIPWCSLDAALSSLAQRVHDAGNKFTLQLNIRKIKLGPFMVDHLLPKFLGYGGIVDIIYRGEPTPAVL